jgi:hypothetical protein
LTRLFSFNLYRRNAEQRFQFVLDDGSGVGSQIHSGAEFLWDKFFLLAEIAHPQRAITAIIFFVILIGGAGLLWLWRSQPGKQNLLAPMWLSWQLNTLWFVALAKTGWPRHFWFGLVLAMLLLSVIPVALIRLGLTTQSGKKPAVTNPAFSITGLAVLGLILWGFALQPYVWGLTVSDEIVPYWQQKQINNKYDASLPWIIIPRAAQVLIT